MIGYVTLGTNDLERASKFFDALFADLGGKRMMEVERGVFWAGPKGFPAVGVMTPFDGGPAAPGNGTMVALNLPGQAEVDALHAKALSLGAADEGAPGPRGGNFYGAYFRDPDGNKFACFCMG